MLNLETEKKSSLIAVNLLALWESSHCKEANMREGSKTVADSSISRCQEVFLSSSEPILYCLFLKSFST